MRAWLDPVTSLVISALIVAGAWGLLRDSVRMSLDAVRAGIDIAEVRGCIAGLAGVDEVHDLHVWSMSTTETALTAHLLMPAGHSGDAFIAQVCHDLHARFGIIHATMQVETDPGHPCALAPDSVV